MKKQITLLLLVSIPLMLWSQTLTQSVKGRITDRESKSPLFGANIILLGSDTLIGTVSDFNGSFHLRVPIGRRTFKISYIGYEDVVLPDVYITSGKEAELNVMMREQFSRLQEVVIQGNADKTQALNSMAAISARQLRTEDAQRYAGGFYDPARMVSSFAGVGATEGDGSNQIVVRGNSPRGLLWRLEGIEIPNPNHFPDGQGDAGGAFCILSSTVLKDFDFYTSAFPAEYGNAYSGVMDISLRQGNAGKREYSFIFGLVGTQFMMEGPFVKGKQASYLISYRYSNFGLLNKAGLLGLAKNHLPPLFQDLNFNLSFPTQKAGNFQLFGSGGQSWTGWNAIKDTSLWKSWDDRKDDTEDHYMGVIGLKHVFHCKNNRTYFRTVAALTHQSDILSTTFILDSNVRRNVYKSDFAFNAIRINVMMHHKFSSRHSIRTGLMSNELQSDMYSRFWNWKENGYDTPVDKTNSTSLYQAYFQWKYRVRENFEINSGLHSMFFRLNQDYSIEPRLGLRWDFAHGQALSAGLGMHTRTENIPAYFALVKNDSGMKGEFNRNLSFTKSLHNVLAYDLNINKNLRFKVETYFQYIYKVPVVDTLNSTMSALNFSYGIPDIVLTNKGTGYNYGMELTLEKFYSDNYYFLFTCSLFDSKYEANNGIIYNTAYNNNHISNFLIGKDFKLGKEKNSVLGVNVKALVRGGFRYTPIDLQKSALAGDEVLNETETFEKQYPLYHRFDLGINYQKNNKGWSWSLSMNIYNILNRKNILYYDLRHDEVSNVYSIKGVEGLGIVPNLNFKIDF